MFCSKRCSISETARDGADGGGMAAEVELLRAARPTLIVFADDALGTSFALPPCANEMAC